VRNKKYWGIATLILLLGVFGVFLFIKDRAEIWQFEEGLAESNQLLEQHNKEKTKQLVAKTDSKPLDEQSFEQVQRNDDSDKVPIAEPDPQIDAVPDQTPLQPEVVIPHIEIPTDAELAKYSREESTELLLSVSQVLDDVEEMWNQYETDSIALSSEIQQIANDLSSGRITLKEWSAKNRELFLRQSNLRSTGKIIRAENERLLKEKGHIRQHIRGL